MAELGEDEIDLVVQVVDSAIDIHVTQSRSTNLVRNDNFHKAIAFLANAHLWELLGTEPTQVFVKPNTESILHFDPPGEYFAQVEH